MSNETPINGQGIRLIKQSEGIDIPLLHPWEVEGEKELLKGSIMLKNVEDIENKLSAMYRYIQSCEESDCGVKDVFDEIMHLRRNHYLPLLQAKQLAIYEILYALIPIYVISRGDKYLFLICTLSGLAVSAELIYSSRK